MSRLARALEAIRGELDAQNASYALVGGLAVSIRTEPRFTRDIDLAVSVESDRQAEELLAGLRAQGYSLLAVVEQEVLDRLATARVASESSRGTVVDLLFASSGVEAEVVAHAEPLEVLPGLVVPVATLGDLVAQKLLSADRSRPQDEADLVSLLEKATPADIARARASVRLIEDRGFHRGRDLVGDLDRRTSS